MPIVKTHFEYDHKSVNARFMSAFFNHPNLEFTALEIAACNDIHPSSVYQGLKLFQKMGYVDPIGRTHTTSNHPSTLWKRRVRLSPLTV